MVCCNSSWNIVVFARSFLPEAAIESCSLHTFTIRIEQILSEPCDFRFSSLKQFLSDSKIMAPFIHRIYSYRTLWPTYDKWMDYVCGKSVKRQNYLPIKYQCCPHIETSQLICTANQLTDFYMRAILALNGLNRKNQTTTIIP